MLFSERWERSGKESDFQAAAERYAKAVEIKPDLHEAWHNWGAMAFVSWTFRPHQQSSAQAQNGLGKYLELTAGRESEARTRVRASARLAALDGLGRNSETTWLECLLGVPEAAQRREALAESIATMARHVSPERLREALLELAQREAMLPDESYVAPYLHALDVLTDRNSAALDRYPPEVLKPLRELFPALAEAVPEKKHGHQTGVGSRGRRLRD